MIDTHCHLTDSRLNDQLDAVLQRAEQAGVQRVVTIGTEPDDARDAIALCKGRDNVRCVIGIHPNYCQNVELSAVDTIRELQHDPSVVALGEMGLDYHHQIADRARQKMFFEAQLQLARELKRPVVLHSREAIADTLDILANFPEVVAVFHSFTGTLEEAQRITARGYYMGFTGPVTYKKNDELRECAKRCPIDQIVVETDAPYLSPEPVRSIRTCEPAFVMHTARKIAEVRGVSVEEMDGALTANAKRLYRWE